MRLTFSDTGFLSLCLLFVDIGGIVDHHCLNFLFIIKWNTMQHIP